MDNTEELLNQYGAEADAGVSFGGLFSALSIFFVGLLISNYDSFPGYVKIPLLFLVISTFGFIYATLIYANATSKLNSDSLKECRKAINTADILSEFMGVYALLISIPLVIPVVTGDIFLVSSVFITDIVGMAVYHVSGFSIIVKYFPKSHFFITGIMIILTALMLILLKSSFQTPLLIFVLVTLFLLITISLFSIKKIPHIG